MTSSAGSRKMEANESPVLIYAFDGDTKPPAPAETKPIRRSIPPFGMGGLGGMSGMGGFGMPGAMGGFGGMGAMGGLGGMGALGMPGAMGGMGGLGYGGLGANSMYNPMFRGSMYPGYNSMASTAGMTFPYWNTQVSNGWNNPAYGFNSPGNYAWQTLNSNPTMYNSGTWGLTNVIPANSGYGNSGFGTNTFVSNGFGSSGFGSNGYGSNGYGSNDLYNSGAWNRATFNSGDPYNQYSGQNAFINGQSGGYPFNNGQSYYNNRYNGQSGFASGQSFGSGTSSNIGSDGSNYKRSPPGPQSPYYVRLYPDVLNPDTEETSSSSLSKSRTTGRRSATADSETNSSRAEPL